MEKSKHMLCEYGRCGGNGLAIAKKPWLARCKLKVVQLIAVSHVLISLLEMD